MAVYCGVCAASISSAAENEGSFPTNDFGGWDGARIRIRARRATCTCLALP